MTTLDDQQAAPTDAPEQHLERFAAALAAWDGYLAAADLGPASRHLYRSIAARFLHRLESHGIMLGEITRLEVEDFLRASGWNPATRSMYRARLRRIFGVLVAHGLMPANPLDGTTPSEPPLTIDNLPGQFTSFTEVERQATVDAADYALLLHGIYLFTEGKGGREADVPLCEAALKLGEEFGITPFSWFEGRTCADSVQDGQAVEQPVETHD